MELSGCGQRLENVFRRMVRRTVPLALRIRVTAARRDFRDRRAAVVFSRAVTSTIDFPYLWAEYRRDFIDHPGQEHLALAKRRNHCRFIVLAPSRSPRADDQHSAVE